MWVLGTQYNQIGGFRIDDRSGNLSSIVGSPVPSGGTHPIMLTIKSGGRYLYVLNAGDSTGATGNFSLFSVGSDGTLSYQQSYPLQGTFPVWITTDTTGKYLYVLNQRSSAYDGKTDLNGSITLFPLDPNTGRPVVAQAASFEVGKTPIQMSSSASCIYTLDSGDQTIFPYSIGSTNGQLTSNPVVALNTANATSVNLGGSYAYVTDAGSTLGGAGSILAFTQGSSCALSPVTGTGGTVANLATASYPIQTIESLDGKYVYVLNHSTVNTNYSNSTISAFTINSNGGLSAITADTNNPYSVGSGPVCMGIDPTNQYIYTSDQFASTVTGKRISNAEGFLSNLNRGSSFPTVGTPSCLVISQNTAY
jgi:6-phosphogluconolactonase (cycloisomerase 2 family)